MANEFLGRSSAVAFAKEAVASGTESVGTKIWLPKISGRLKPETTRVQMEGAFAVIDDVSDSAIESRGSMLDVELFFGAVTAGHLLNAAFGQSKLCKVCTITGASGGTPARGDSISSTAGTWTGKIWKVITIGATTYYAVEQLTGTLSGQTDVTNGTWTGGTLAITSSVNAHYFSRSNTNNHPSYSLYDYAPSGQYKATYGMMETLGFEFVRGDWAKLKTAWKARGDVSTSGLNPSFATEDFFVGKHCGVKIAANEAALNAASLIPTSKFTFEMAKNLIVAQESRATGVTVGDPRAIFNGKYVLSASFEALENASTYRDYVTANTKYAVRQEWINSDAAALNTGIYPSLYIDFDRVQFSAWDAGDSLDDLTTQTLEIVPEYDKSTGYRCDALLINSQATAY